MVALSVPNVITIALISLAAVALAKFGFKAIGWSADWL